MVDLSQESNLVPQPVLAPDAVISDGLHNTEVGGGELDAGALAFVRRAKAGIARIAGSCYWAVV